MFQIVLIFTIAIGVGLGAGGPKPGNVKIVTATGADASTGSLLDGTHDDSADAPADVASGGWQPEPQEPTGKFTTATEVKPILAMTKTAWVAVREYEGNDLLYFTQLVAWRCGLHGIYYGLNGGPEQVFEVEDCYLETAQPNAMKMETHVPYITLGLGAVKSMSVTLVFDDGTKDTATYKRSDILMP